MSLNDSSQEPSFPVALSMERSNSIKSNRTTEYMETLGIYIYKITSIGKLDKKYKLKEVIKCHESYSSILIKRQQYIHH